MTLSAGIHSPAVALATAGSCKMPTPWLYDCRTPIDTIKEALMRLATAVLMTVALVSGCAMEEQSRADFERHNSSILRTSYQGGDGAI